MTLLDIPLSRLIDFNTERVWDGICRLNLRRADSQALRPSALSSSRIKRSQRQ